MAQVTAQETLATEQVGATLSVPQHKWEVLEQLAKPEMQEALGLLIANLPKLAEMAAQLVQAYETVQTLANDQVFIDDFKGGMEEFVKPIQTKAKGLAAATIEANDRAQTSSATIGIFGMLKMLKDPQVQHMLRFTQAFLDVTGEQKKQG